MNQFQADPTLDTILNDLCADAQNAVVTALRGSDSLRTARLVCRSLRAFIDSGILCLHVLVKPHDRRRFAAGNDFPLWRWPRLGSLRVDAYPCANLCASLALPLLFQPATALEHITHLELRSCGLKWRDEAATTLFLLLSRMTGLRSIFFMGIPLPPKPLQQRCLYGALAVLPHFEEMRVDIEKVLPRLHLLADRLRRLSVVTYVHRDWESELAGPAEYPEFLASLQQMRRLEELDFNNQYDTLRPDRVVQLLDSLPSCMLKVSVKGYLAAPLELHLECGRIQEVHIEGVDFTDLASYADTLPRCGAFGGQLRALRLGLLYLSGKAWPSDDQVQQVRLLVLRCKEVSVEQLIIDDSPPASRTLDLVEMLAFPEKLCMYSAKLSLALYLRNRGDDPPSLSSPRQQHLQQTAALTAPATAAAADGAQASPWADAHGPQMVALLSELVLGSLEHDLARKDFTRAAQEFLDSGAGGSERERLRLMLELGAELALNPQCWELEQR